MKHILGKLRVIVIESWETSLCHFSDYEYQEKPFEMRENERGGEMKKKQIFFFEKVKSLNAI